MQKIKQMYRSNYAGEEILRELNYTGGAWVKTAEYVPSAVTNRQISNRAVVLGNGPSRTELYPNGNLFQLLDNHKGGLLQQVQYRLTVVMLSYVTIHLTLL